MDDNPSQDQHYGKHFWHEQLAYAYSHLAFLLAHSYCAVGSSTGKIKHCLNNESSKCLPLSGDRHGLLD